MRATTLAVLCVFMSMGVAMATMGYGNMGNKYWGKGLPPKIIPKPIYRTDNSELLYLLLALLFLIPLRTSSSSGGGGIFTGGGGSNGNGVIIVTTPSTG